MSEFNAAEATLGFLYQVRLALLLLIRKTREEPVTTITIEKLDDIAFEKDGKAVELLQAKHHVKSKASLSDASVDLWKTLRIWIDAAKTKSILLPGTVLSMVTTAKATDGSAASFLRASSRDVTKALAILSQVPASSSNKENATAYAAFTALSEIEKELLLEAVFVLDGAPAISEVENAIEKELRFVAPTEHLGSLRTRLEGWWFGRTVRHLLGTDLTPISGDELDAHVADLREQFLVDNLPIDPDVVTLDISDAPDALPRTFVRQLQLIGVSQRRITSAISDYYRAFAQRSRWLREHLVPSGELERYEVLLVDEWQRHFDAMADRIGPHATEKAKRKAALSLYEWVELEASFNIRPRCTAPFVMRGSFHGLADDQRIGWHVDFLERLNDLLCPSEKTA